MSTVSEAVMYTEKSNPYVKIPGGFLAPYQWSLEYITGYNLSKKYGTHNSEAADKKNSIYSCKGYQGFVFHSKLPK